MYLNKTEKEDWSRSGNTERDDKWWLVRWRKGNVIDDKIKPKKKTKTNWENFKKITLRVRMTKVSNVPSSVVKKFYL